jgi:hypothetical protein
LICGEPCNLIARCTAKVQALELIQPERQVPCVESLARPLMLSSSNRATAANSCGPEPDWLVVVHRLRMLPVSGRSNPSVGNSNRLNAAMTELENLTEKIVRERLGVFAGVDAGEIFDDPKDTWIALSRESMGVPRTIGIVLQQAWYRAAVGAFASRRITSLQVSYGSGGQRVCPAGIGGPVLTILLANATPGTSSSRTVPAYGLLSALNSWSCTFVSTAAGRLR